MVVDVLFLCFAIDTKYNDGSPGREFYMDKVLMASISNALHCFRDESSNRMKPVTLMNELSLKETGEEDPLGMDVTVSNAPRAIPFTRLELTLINPAAPLPAVRWI